MIAEHGADVAAKRFAQARHDGEAGPTIAVRAPAIVAGQYAKIVIEPSRQLGGPLHRSLAHIRMKVAQVKDGKAVEGVRQQRETHRIADHLHLACVRPTPPIGPGRAQHDLDQDPHDRHVFDVQDIEPLPEGLRLVLALHS